MAKEIKRAIIASSVILMMTGCASQSSNSGFFPEGGLSVNEIYKQTIMSGDDLNKSSRLKGSNERRVNYRGYTRDAQNETNRLFKAKKNPLVPIYIAPHVAKIGDEEVPKPGYTTSFQLFKKNKYALNWERY